VLQAGLDELKKQSTDLQHALEQAGETPAYIEYRLKSFGFQIELQMLMLFTARTLDHDDWTPPPAAGA
jgi:hypothetical protein